MKYNVGDKVLIVDLKTRKHQKMWNSSGLMDKYCGSIMTIRGFSHGFYKMEEDIFDTSCNLKPGWDWAEEMIEALAPQEDSSELCEEVDKSLHSFLNEFKIEGEADK